MSSITVPLEKFGKALEKQIKGYEKQVRFAAMNAINAHIRRCGGKGMKKRIIQID